MQKVTLPSSKSILQDFARHFSSVLTSEKKSVTASEKSHD